MNFISRRVHRLNEWGGMNFLIQKDSLTYTSKVDCNQIKGYSFYLLGAIEEDTKEEREADNR